jgi:hypothetical protein
MKKLVAVGCSFTHWHFPTVPDWMGYCFDEYENLGSAGGGNRYIFNQLFDYIQDNDITDTFFYIQWSGIPRRDWMGVGNTHWNTLGTFNPDDGIDDTTQLNLFQFSTEFRNYLYTTKTFLDLKGIPYIMNHMLDTWFQGSLGEPGIGTVPNHIFYEGIKLIREKGHLDDIKKLSETNFLKPCLEFFSIDNNNKDMGHLSLGQVNESCPDYHLHPKLCLKYVREIVYPSLKDKIDLESIFDKNLDNLAEHWNMKLKNYEWLLKHRILFDKRDYASYEVKLPFYLKSLDN